MSTEITHTSTPAVEVMPRTPDTRAVYTELSRLEVITKGLTIESDDDAITAKSILSELNAQKKLVGDLCDPNIAIANTLHKNLTGQRKKILDFIDDIAKRVTGKMNKFIDERTKLAKKLEEDAAKKAAAERAALEKQAAVAMKRGDAELASELKEQAAAWEPPPMPDPRPSVSGLSIIEKEVPEVVDLAAFVKAVAAGTIPLELETIVSGKTSVRTLLKVDEVVLRAIANQHGPERVKGWPGVKLKTNRQYRTSDKD